MFLENFAKTHGGSYYFVNTLNCFMSTDRHIKNKAFSIFYY
jgi:hypothetical protein